MPEVLSQGNMLSKVGAGRHAWTWEREKNIYMGDGSMSRENVIFIGFMGAGKTSVGRAYAQTAGIPLVDTDQMIEEEAGMTISDIFRLKGEEFFRENGDCCIKKAAEGNGAEGNFSGRRTASQGGKQSSFKGTGTGDFSSGKSRNGDRTVKGRYHQTSSSGN